MDAVSTPTTLEPLDVTRALKGRRVLFAGVTGFVGKVTLSMLLHHYGETLERVYVVVRKGGSRNAKDRFLDKVARSEPFQPLRDKYGDTAALLWLEQKCEVLDGDISQPWAGIEESTARALKGKIDAVVNCAGLVTFNPPLEVGLSANTRGVRYLADACVFWDVPLVHVSTAFVAGNRSGLVFENEPLAHYFPRQEELQADFSLAQELLDCEKVVARLREAAEDRALASEFRERASQRLAAEGRDAKDEKTLRLAIGRERKLWLSNKLVAAGMDRAHQWGWPNTYTYTKSLGERELEGTPGLAYAIVRPSIVESAMHYPFPGWNEGFTTSAPMIYAMFKSFISLPAGNNAILDIIPVDMVASALIAVLAQQLRTRERKVYQVASGDTMPLEADRSIELIGLYKRRRIRRRDNSDSLANKMKSRIEPQALSKRAFDLLSSPMLGRGSRWLQSLIDQRRPSWGAPRVSALLDKAKERLGDFAEQSERLSTVVDLFLPFCWDNRFIFRCDNTRALFAQMPAADRFKLHWTPEAIDWRSYFFDVHIPGLEKWVFPELDEETKLRKAVRAYRDLLELFDASVHDWRHRVAFRMYEGDEIRTLSYGDVQRYADRVGAFLSAKGVLRGSRVMLLSENRPEWGIAFFGILRCGATVVPVDKELSDAEIINVAKRSGASQILVSDAQLLERPTLIAQLHLAKLQIAAETLGNAMSGTQAGDDLPVLPKKQVAPDDVAALIFTSGTTATPKAVMLTHRNYASLVAKLAGAFDLSSSDGVLSVLPLHHTFEFSAGFLTPFSRGSEITYIDELNADRLGEVLDTGRISALVGVPAVWQLLHRRLLRDLSNRPRLIDEGVRALMGLNEELRNRRDLNLGKVLFWPIHRKFGGHLRVLVSGGSALPDDVHKAFHALGFNLDEGYGLAEAAPVLSVSRGGNKRMPGSVGRALPGIELKIHDPDAEGIGEVIAKGPNVMAGYFEDRAATDAVLKEGWLYTGDLGRLDAEGHLFLVGRQKDVIIDANGKNVFPDEIEELYGAHKHIKELSVVGLSDDAGGEKVACLCVPEYLGRPKDDVRRELTEHFRVVSAAQPFYRRVKLMRFWESDLPRTSTRKVKRRLVSDELKKLERLSASLEAGQAAASNSGSNDWLLQVIADVLQRPVSQVQMKSQLQTDLGFDSLTLAELATSLDAAGVPRSAVDDLSKLGTVEEVLHVVQGAGFQHRGSSKGTGDSLDAAKEASDASPTALELELPEPVVNAGARILALGQGALYRRFFDVKVQGQKFIPQNRNVLVIANHASHLDMGLVKHAMGEQGSRLVALAARDYFFDTPLKRAYFENFTNLIPMDRKGSVRESLRLAGQALSQGYSLLIFPEGTRTTNGEMRQFKPTVGYLALTFGVDVLPMYLQGTFDALPRGAVWPKRSKLQVRIGTAISVEFLKGKTAGLARSDRYKVVTAMGERAVRALSEGQVLEQEALMVPIVPTRDRVKPLPVGGEVD